MGEGAARAARSSGLVGREGEEGVAAAAEPSAGQRSAIRSFARRYGISATPTPTLMV